MSSSELPEQREPPKGVRPSLVGVAALFPPVDAFVAWWNGRVEEQSKRDMHEFVGQVAVKVNELIQSDLADQEHLRSHEFARTIVAAAESARRSPDASKIRYLSEYVVAHARVKRPDRNVAQVFWEFVHSLAGMHLLLLDFMYARQRSVGEAGLEALLADATRSESVSFRELANVASSEDLLVECLVSELEARSLVRRRSHVSGSADNSDRVVLTRIGMRFMRFLSQQW